MTSDCVAFSTCRIQFIPNDQQRTEREYSDRSLIELRQYDFANYALRALDIENNKEVGKLFQRTINDKKNNNLLL
jgi:hypothetical protein